jgi:glycosyltransferase involved in cell wall biosynthesis
MRILQVIPSLTLADGGPPWVLTGLAESAAAAGAEVTVCAIHPGIEGRQSLDERVDVRLFERDGGLAFPWSSGLAEFLDSMAGRFDVVHVHSVYRALTSRALAAARRSQRPVVLTAHGALMTGAIRPWQVWKLVWVKTQLRRRWRSVIKLHALSALERDRSAWAGLATFVHAPLWRLRPGEAASAPRDDNYVVALGRVHPIKRLEVVLDALAGVRFLRLVIAGRGEASYEARLRQRAERLGLCRRVTWAGHVSGIEKRRLLRGARCLVQASRLESFGVAVLEAMAAGVPVAVARSVAAADQVMSSNTGVVVDERGVTWVDVFRSVLDSPTRWDSFAAGAAAWATSLPSVEESGRALVGMYGEACACGS